MLYQFKQALHLDGKDYPRGVHDLTEKAENHQHFLRYVGAGLIVDVEAAKVVSTETIAERSQRLMDRIITKRDAKAVKKSAAEEKTPEVHEAHDEDASHDKAPEEHVKGAEKKKKR